ncbi:hypothetical protein FA95DRAFT_1611337 [Auriscalpium vulgare]|uniref:Uncharacterized protein n=1 Tax=Auriscalpium vulgare TaxID=40419 RepID=A0ACB8RAB3_9AGAM|nr:hypothetical protein FA95DRAFT_1611337 [Auriscalpium vulgare]
MSPRVNQAGSSQGVALTRGTKRSIDWDHSTAPPRPAKETDNATPTRRLKPTKKPSKARNRTPMPMPNPAEVHVFNLKMEPVVTKRRRIGNADAAAARPSERTKTTPESAPLVTNTDTANPPSDITSPVQPALSHTVPASRKKRPRQHENKDEHEGCHSDRDDEPAPLRKKVKTSKPQNATRKPNDQLKLGEGPAGRYYIATRLRHGREVAHLGNPKMEKTWADLAGHYTPQQLEHVWKSVPQICPMPSCDVKAPSKDELFRNHIQETHHICGEFHKEGERCLDGINRDVDLGRHKKGKSGLKPHVCEPCGKAYVRKDSLVRHGKEKHRSSKAEYYMKVLS